MNDKNRVYPFLGTKNKVTKDSMTCSDESAINFHMTLIFKHFFLNFQQDKDHYRVKLAVKKIQILTNYLQIFVP